MSDLLFSTFLSRSIGLIARELPSGHAALCQRLSRREIEFQVDGEWSAIIGTRMAVEIARFSRAPEVRARFSKAVLADLLDVRTTLLDALLEDRFELFGASQDLVTFHEVLLVYFASAARCPSFPGLLNEFLENP